MYVMAPTGTGWVEVVVGCMFSGKTSELVRRLTRATIAKQRVIAFKPEVDNRHDTENLVSHEGVFTGPQSFQANQVGSALDILEASADAQVVGIDEAQFFDETLPDVIEKLAQQGKRVIVAGLDLDYRGNPFGVVPELMARADAVSKEYAVCMICGSAATRSQRIADSDATVLVGAESVYQARCRDHWSPEPVLTRQANTDIAEG